jgi:hypothetical protein
MRQKTSNKVETLIEDLRTFGWIPGNVPEIAKKYHVDSKIVYTMRDIGYIVHDRKQDRVVWDKDSPYHDYSISALMLRLTNTYNKTVTKVRKSKTIASKQSFIQKLISLFK